MTRAGTDAAYEANAPDRSGGFSYPVCRVFIMKESSAQNPSEPVGIVISSGTSAEKAPRFSAYVWSYGPEAEVEVEAKAA